jgi:hypothetical protein
MFISLASPGFRDNCPALLDYNLGGIGSAYPEFAIIVAIDLQNLVGYGIEMPGTHFQYQNNAQ